MDASNALYDTFDSGEFIRWTVLVDIILYPHS